MSWHGGLANVIQEAIEIPSGSGSANVNGGGVDMAGWDGVAFYIGIGAITGAGVYTAYVQTANDGDPTFTAPTNVADAGTGAAAALPAGLSTPNTVCVIDVFRPSGRYARLNISPSVNTVAYSVMSMRYRRDGLLPPRPASASRVVIRAN